MTNVSIAAALLAGMLSFLSPCVLPLVPPYLVYLTGTSLERLADGETKPGAKRQTIVVALLFVLGFSIVFVAYGAALGGLGHLLTGHARLLTRVLGALTIALGLLFAIEGLVFAAFPGAAKRAMESVLATPEHSLRLVGLVSAVAGVLLIWFVRG